MATLTFIYHTLTSSSSSTLRSNYRAQKQESPATLSIVNKNPNQNPILELGKKKRGVSVITRAGPSSTSYIFAFVFPLSLLAVTIFSAMRISDELDEKFLEEVRICAYTCFFVRNLFHFQVFFFLLLFAQVTLWSNKYSLLDFFRIESCSFLSMDAMLKLSAGYFGLEYIISFYGLLNQQFLLIVMVIGFCNSSSRII